MNISNRPQRQFFPRKRNDTECMLGDHYGIIHLEFLNCNQTLNADLYSQQLQRVHETLLRKFSMFIIWRNVVLLFDNTKLHSVRIVQKKYWIYTGLFYLINQTLYQMIFIFFCSLQNTLNDKISPQDQMKIFVENLLNSKRTEFT